MLLTSNCLLCGLPIYEDHYLVIPKAKTHEHCQQKDGRHPDDLADAFPCCHSKNILYQLGGSIIQIQDGIPKDQVWVYNRKEKQIHRYKILDHGDAVLELVGEGAPNVQP